MLNKYSCSQPRAALMPRLSEKKVTRHYPTASLGAMRNSTIMAGPDLF